MASSTMRYWMVGIGLPTEPIDAAAGAALSSGSSRASTTTAEGVQSARM
jgi:hypothetical protein